MCDGNSFVYLDVSLDGRHEGRITVELFTRIAPRATKYFFSACVKNRPVHPHSLKGRPFFALERGSSVWAGSAPEPSRTSSALGFRWDEAGYKLKHDHGGLLSLPETSFLPTFHFQISTVPCPHLDGRNCIFGRVVGGMNVVTSIEHMPAGPQNEPLCRVLISDCGEVNPSPKPTNQQPFSHTFGADCGPGELNLDLDLDMGSDTDVEDPWLAVMEGVESPPRKEAPKPVEVLLSPSGRPARVRAGKKTSGLVEKALPRLEWCTSPPPFGAYGSPDPVSVNAPKKKAVAACSEKLRRSVTLQQTPRQPKVVAPPQRTYSLPKEVQKEKHFPPKFPSKSKAQPSTGASEKEAKKISPSEVFSRAARNPGQLEKSSHRGGRKTIPRGKVLGQPVPLGTQKENFRYCAEKPTGPSKDGLSREGETSRNLPDAHPGPSLSPAEDVGRIFQDLLMGILEGSAPDGDACNSGFRAEESSKQAPAPKLPRNPKLEVDVKMVRVPGKGAGKTPENVSERASGDLELGRLSDGRVKLSDGSSPSSKLTLRAALSQATDTVLVCTSILHDLVHEASVAAEKSRKKKGHFGAEWRKTLSVSRHKKVPEEYAEKQAIRRADMQCGCNMM